jgi:hypothetical protein
MKQHPKHDSIGRSVARAVFDKRVSRKGQRNVEVHLSEPELAAIAQAAADMALRGSEAPKAERLPQ